MVGCRLKYYESFKDCWAVDTAACEDWEEFVFRQFLFCECGIDEVITKKIIYLLPYA
jgi:hypothetical protein